MKKKMFAAGLTLALILSMMACGSKSGSTEYSKDSDALTIKDGTLMVGMEIGYPPMEYFDEDGTTPIGFDVEVAQAIAEEMDMELEIVDTAWDGIFAGVDAEKYDCVISSVSITEERQENYLLTEPYVANKLVLVVPKDSDLDSPEVLEEHSVAVQAETTADEYMKELLDGGMTCDLLQYDKVINCFEDLKAGRVESVLVDSVVAAYYLGEDAEAYKTSWENTEGEPIGICLKKGNTELCEKIEAAVDALYENGKMAEIAEKYFGSNITEGLR